MFALAVLTLTFVSAPAQAQVNAIKDGWLVTKIHSEFVDEDVLSGSNIDVDVKNGMVTLQGTVPSEAARARAIASRRRTTDGVKSVTDQLRIAPAHDRGTIDKAQDTTTNAATRPARDDKAADKTEDAARQGRRQDGRAARRRPAAPSTTAGSSRRSTRSTWPTGTPCSTTATSTLTSRTTWSR